MPHTTQSDPHPPPFGKSSLAGKLLPFLVGCILTISLSFAAFAQSLPTSSRPTTKTATSKPLVSGTLPKDFVLRWGADSSGGMPFTFSSPQDPNKLIGFEKEIVDAISKILGVKNRFVRANWATLVPDLQRSTFDIIINGLEPTSDRAKLIAFSKPYYIFRQQLTVRSNEKKIKSLDDCKGRLIGTLGNTAASRLLESKGLKYRGYDDQTAAYKDLEIGRIDAVLMDYPIALYFANSPRFKPAGAPFHRGAYIIGMRKQDKLLKQKVDAAIDEIMRDGTLERILRKWRLWDDIQKELASGTAKYEITRLDFNWPSAFKRLGQAALITIGLAIGSMLIAMLLGLLVALGQLHTSPWLRFFCGAYVEFFRGTPVLVQLLFLYFGLPLLGITIPNWLTAIIGLGLNYAAYESQVYRTALQAIPQGQWEAAAVLGMSPGLTFRRVIFPQAFRIALPPMTNDFVALFKDTSVAFAISVWELATAYRELASASQKFMVLGALTALFYLAMSLPLAFLARRLESKLQGKNEQTPEA
ncbi:MAG: ABC transporter permease subunit [Myxococcales bacterium]|nr:ABC transporter permease subunit [Myxococcales bacterium]